MDDAVVVRADDNDVRGVVVLRMGKIVDVVGREQRAHRNWNGHPIIQQRPVHRLLQYESIVVIHQSYISFFIFLFTSYCLLSLSRDYRTSILRLSMSLLRYSLKLFSTIIS